MPTKRYLEITDTGVAFVDVDAQGKETRSPATTEEAFAYIEAVIEEPEHYRVRGNVSHGDTEVLKLYITKKLMQLIRLRSFELERQGSTFEQFVEDVRFQVGNSGAVRYLEEYGAATGAGHIIAEIWPELGVPAAEDAPTDDTALAGSANQGTAPLPDGRSGRGGNAPKPKPGAGGGATPDGSRAGDPVLPASGALLLEEVDLEVDGVGLDVRLVRTYLHNADYDGHMGQNWDHSYNLWLRESVRARPGGFDYVVERSSGRLTADRFRFEGTLAAPADLTGIADGVFAPPDGTHERLVKAGGRFVLESADGRRVVYNEHLRAERLEDPNGNRLLLRYPNDPRLLEEVVDSCGRVLRFAYDERGLLVHVRDTALGRDVQYAYDDQRRLIGVRHSTGDPDRPARLRAYRYWGDGAPPGLQHNLLAVTDPRGVEVLQVRYGREPGLPSYNRVVEERDGGVTTYEYDFLFEPGEFVTTLPADSPAVRVRMRGPTDERRELDYNGQGRMIRHAIFDPSAPAAPPVETRWGYNADARVVREERPSGAVVEYEYGRERFARLGGDPASASADERLRFGELRKVVEHARPGAGGPPQRITELDYHPRFGLVTERRGPYYADATGLRVDAGPSFSVRCEYDARANLVAVAYPDCTQADGSLQSGRRLTLALDPRGRLLRRAIDLGGGEELATEYEYPPDADPSCSCASAEILDATGAGLRRGFEADAAGRLTRIEEASGRVTRRSLDHLGRLVREERTATPGGAPSVIETLWAPHDRPERMTTNRLLADGSEDSDALLEQTWSWDAEGEVASSRLRSADGRLDRRTLHEHDPAGRLTRLVALGVETRYRYDGNGQIAEQQVGAPGVAPARFRHGYDPDGALVRLEDSEGHVELRELDGFGRIARRTLPGGSVEEMEWDAADRPLRVALGGAHPDRAGPAPLREDRLEWDEGGRLRATRTAVFDPADAQAAPQWSETRYLYDRADRIRGLEGPGGYRCSHRHDGLGRLTAKRDNAGVHERWHYDDAGRELAYDLELEAADPSGAPRRVALRWLHRLDVAGNLVEEVDPLGNVQRYEWDSRGYMTASVDSAGIARRELLEPDGAVREVRAAAGTADELAWTYERDGMGQVVAVHGPRGRVLAIERDALGRATRIEHGPPGLMAPTSVEYDSQGRVVRSTDGRGVTTRFGYDAAGLVERVAFDPPNAVAGPAEIRYRHDGAGLLFEATDGALTVERRHDSRGRLLRETVAGATVSWSYDLAGYPRAFSFPDGRRLDHARDAAGRLLSISEGAAGAANPAGAAGPGPLVERWPLGPAALLAERWRGAVERTESLDDGGRLLRAAERSHPGGGTLLDARRIADARGLPSLQQLELDGASRSELLDADALERLTTVARHAGLAPVATGGLEAGGGASQVDHDAAVAALAAQAGGQPDEELRYTLAADGARTRSRRFAAGAQVEDTTLDVDAGGRTVAVDGVARSYDGDGRLAQAGARRFQHDGSGQLTRVDDGGAPVLECLRDPLGRPHRLRGGGFDLRVVSDGGRIVELRDAGGPRVHYVRGDDDAPLELGAGGAAFRPLAGVDGSILGLANDSGVLVGGTGYDPFGVPDGGLAAPLLGFHGLPLLPDVGLYLTERRAYDPAIGAFVEPDPAGLVDGLNRYAYGRGHPYAFTDPGGLMAVPQGKTGTAGEPPGGQHGGSGGGGTGTHNASGVGGSGDDRELRWYERAFVAVAGAVGALVDNFVIEPTKMLYDVAGLGVASLGVATGWWDYEHEVESGIGRLAASGKDTGEILVSMGRSVVEAPGRIWSAAERGDWYGFGAESMNLYMVGRDAAGLGRGTASFAYNRGVHALGRIGQGKAALANPQVMFRGGAGQEGAGMLWVRNWQALSPADQTTLLAAMRDMDFQAGTSGGFVRQRVTRPMRRTANRMARIGRRLLGLDTTQAAGHIPDTGMGGNPIGVIMGLPRSVNGSWGGQLARYQPGFRFTGLSLVDRATGQYVYPSLSLEHAPLQLNPW